MRNFFIELQGRCIGSRIKRGLFTPSQFKVISRPPIEEVVYQYHASNLIIFIAEKVLIGNLWCSMIIDDIAQRIVSSFNSENAVKLKEGVQDMIRQIKYEESMFSIVSQPYLVAKSLYFMLTEDYLKEDNQISSIKLAYFCLLNNFLKNCDKKPGDAEYENLVSGSKLALVLIYMQNQYLMYSIIARQAGYINPDTHMRNQILLFGGIAKEAEMAHHNFPLEDVIKSYYAEIFSDLSSHLPIKGELSLLKQTVTPVIKNIKSSISANLKEGWSDDF